MDEWHLPFPPASPGTRPFASVRSLLRRHLPRASPRALQFAAAHFLHCLPILALLSSRSLNSRLKYHYRCLPLSSPYTTSKQALAVGPSKWVSRQVLWFVTVSREKIKSSKKTKQRIRRPKQTRRWCNSTKINETSDFQVYNNSVSA